MFNGIVQEVAVITHMIEGDIKQLYVQTKFADRLNLGDSVAINGVCLTVTQKEDDRVRLDVISETLSKTNLGDLNVGSTVNLELPLQYHNYISGHLVQGHVDGVGVVDLVLDSESEKTITIKLSKQLSHYMITKGCISIDGTSLTIVRTDSDLVTVALIPHTLSHTIAQHYQVGTRVNIEVDMVSKYLEKYATGESYANA